MGKTQISIELAYQAREMYPDCAVFWIPAANMDSLEKAYHEVAHELGINLDDSQDVKLAVQKHLSQLYIGRWFLVFDNADDLSMWVESPSSSNTAGLRGLLPRTDQGRGAILFTTRSTKVAQYLASEDVMKIPEMDEHRAIRVLKNSLVDKNLLSDTKSVQELLVRLTFLPLAIVQAASFINENMSSISSYVELLDGQGQDVIDLLSEEFEDEGHYGSIRNPVATTWLTSFTQIQQQNSLAAEYLSFMACINAKEIPIQLLPPATKLEQKKALGILCSYSFVTCNGDGTLFDMHRLVHLAIRNWLKSVDSLRDCQMSTLRQISKQYPNYDPVQRSEWQLALPHALQILEITSTEAATEERTELLHMAATCSYLDGSYKAAAELFSQALECSEEVFGHDDYRTLKTKSSLADAYQHLGQMHQTTRILEEVLQSQHRVNGQDSLNTMECQAQLACAYRLSGNLDIAEELGAQATRFLLATLGPEQESTLWSMSSMTCIYTCQGRLSDAAKMAQVSLKIRRKASGPSSPEVIHAIAALADIYWAQRKLKEAEGLYLEGLEKGRKVLGSEHPAVARDMNQLALTLKDQGRHSEALSTMTEYARLQEKCLGSNHALTVQAYELITDWTTNK